MNIAIIGYGKMGKEIEAIINNSKHKVCAIIDSQKDWEENINKLKEVDVAIEFSQPDVVINNIKKCFELNIPIVVGTTGWDQQHEEIKSLCLKNNQAMVWGSNFSIGVNMFFALNKKMAEMNAKLPSYLAEIEETHHITKLDAPSGTALQLANTLIETTEKNKTEGVEQSINVENLKIEAKRISNTPGTHIVKFTSDNDTIELKHIALNRKDFAKGAIYAAEWIVGKKGFFSNFDVFNF